MAWKVMMLGGLFLMTALAGCIGGTDEPGSDEPAPNTEPGAADDPAAAMPPGAVAPASSAPASVEVPVSWDGSTGSYVFACTIALCDGAALPSDFDQVYELEPGTTALDVTLTFDGLTGQELAIGVLDKGCQGDCEVHTYARGGSGTPLSADLPPTEDLILVVWHPFDWYMVAGYQAGLETSFHVEGLVVVGGA